jgi:hypothetical protein
VLPPCEPAPPLLLELPLDRPTPPPPLDRLPPPLLEPDPELVSIPLPELEPEAVPPELEVALPDDPEPLEEPPTSPGNPVPGGPEAEHAMTTMASTE